AHTCAIEQAQAGVGEQRRPRTGEPPVARIPADAGVSHARSRRRHGGKEAAPGAAAEGAGGDEGRGPALRLCGRHARGCGDGTRGGCAGDRRAGPVSYRKEIARRAPGDFAKRIARTARRVARNLRRWFRSARFALKAPAWEGGRYKDRKEMLRL